MIWLGIDSRHQEPKQLRLLVPNSSFSMRQPQICYLATEINQEIPRGRYSLRGKKGNMGYYYYKEKPK